MTQLTGEEGALHLVVGYLDGMGWVGLGRVGFTGWLAGWLATYHLPGWRAG